MLSDANALYRTRARHHRGYAADTVFNAVAAEILRGEMPAESAFPSEGALSDRFGVSKVVVRQAVHRLAELGLVAVRQGGTTRVLDPREATDVRVIELFYQLAPDSKSARDLVRDVHEKQFTQGLSLVEVFTRRASQDDRRALVQLVIHQKGDVRNDKSMRKLEERFWGAVSLGGGNRILNAEVRWWYRAADKRPTLPNRPAIELRYKFYRALAERMLSEDGPIEFYLKHLGPGMKALFGKRNDV